MTFRIKQGTAITDGWGPFVDSTDGVTPETALTIQKANVRLKKNGGNMAAASANQGSADVGAPHDEIGVYDGALNATDTDTLGVLRVDIQVSGAAPYWKEYEVVPANVYDSLVGGTDKLFVDTVELNSSAAAASNLSAAARAIVPFSVDTAGGFSPTITQFESNLSEATANHYKDRVVEFYTGALAGQICQVSSHTLQSGRVRFTVTTMTEAPANGDLAVLL